MKGIINTTSGKGGALDAWPVGSIFISTTATSPAESIGGLWQRFGEGRCLIGEGTSDQAFANGTTGGESSHALSVAEMPAHGHFHTPKGSSGSHSHWYTPKGTISGGEHSHSFGRVTGNLSGGDYAMHSDAHSDGSTTIGPGGAHSHTFTGTSESTGGGSGSFSGTRSKSEDEGGGAVHNNLPPYIVVYMWVRLADEGRQSNGGE